MHESEKVQGSHPSVSYVHLAQEAATNISSYSSALSLSDNLQEVGVIKRNRSLAYLKIRQYDAALDDTGFPTLDAEFSEKAMFRAAEALYHLGRYKLCSKVLETLLGGFPGNKQAVNLSERARQRCIEESTGAYDFKMLQEEMKRVSPPLLDHATYIGPVERRETESKGRGLFLTKSVKAGDLLLCEKAFSYAPINGAGGNDPNGFLLPDIQKNELIQVHGANVLRLLASKLYNNPSLTASLTGLHVGSGKMADATYVDEQAIVDT